MNKCYPFLLSAFFLLCFTTSKAQVVISELNYHSDSTVNAGDWVELWNNSGSAVNISGWKLVDGNLANPPYVIPNGTNLAPDARLVLVDNLTRFDQQHPGVTRVGPLGFEFSNSGEMVTLQDAAGLVKVQFMYDDSLPWNKSADGLGRTLELIDPAVGASVATNWRCGCIKGSPGAPFTPCTSETLLISEINYKSLPTAEAGDWVEIWNKTNGSLNVSGYKFRDDNNNNVYTFPGGTILNPQERLVLFNDAVNFTVQFPGVTKKIGPFNFSLDGNGDGVRIYNASDRLVQSLWYDDDGNWPKCPDGNGFTLELDTLFAQPQDITSYASWFCGCPKGSPTTAFIDNCNFDMDEAAAAVSVQIWPNPAQELLYVELGQGTAEYKIISMDGKVWRSGQTYTQTQTIPVADLPAGVYVLSVTQNGRAKQVKWIKAN